MSKSITTLNRQLSAMGKQLLISKGPDKTLNHAFQTALELRSQKLLNLPPKNKDANINRRK